MKVIRKFNNRELDFQNFPSIQYIYSAADSSEKRRKQEISESKTETLQRSGIFSNATSKLYR